jgi:hypothetical protein
MVWGKAEVVARRPTSSSCLATRERPTIETVIGRGNVVKNLFVGNLDSKVTQAELRRLFEAYGQVAQIHIIVDRDTGPHAMHSWR